MPDPTFDCGTFLAGFGPGNLEDGDAGDRVWGGNDDDDPPIHDWDGPIIGPPGSGPPQEEFYTLWFCTGPPEWKCFSKKFPKDTPPPPDSFKTKALCEVDCDDFGWTIPPGGGGGGGGGPGIGPVTPDGGFKCACRMTGDGVSTTSPGTPTGTFYKTCWKQKCEKKGKRPTSHEQIESETLVLYSTGMRNIKVTGADGAGKNCTKPSGCKAGDKECDDICITWFDPEDEDRYHAPTTGGFDDGGDTGGGDTGGDVTGGEIRGGDTGGDTGAGFTPVDDTGTSTGGGLTSSEGNSGYACLGGICVYLENDTTGQVLYPTPAACWAICGYSAGGGRTTIGPPLHPEPTGVDPEGPWVAGEDSVSTGGGVTSTDDGDNGGGGFSVDSTTRAGAGLGNRSGGTDAGAGFSTAFTGGSQAGGAIQQNSRLNKQSLIEEVRQSGELNLDDPRMAAYFSKKSPTGIIDGTIAINSRKIPSFSMVNNDIGHTNILDSRIHEAVAYVLKNNNKWGDWDSGYISNITVDNVINSLNPKFLQMLKSIKHTNGVPLSSSDIYKIVGSRIIDGTLGRLDVKYLQRLSDKSKKRNPINIIKSSNSTLNEMAALNMLERNFIPLDPSSSQGRNSQIMQNWKVLSTDIGKYLPITVRGVEQKFYISDDDFVVPGRDLKVHDGDYVEIFYKGKKTKFYCNSQISHAYLTDGATRQKALNLMGSDGKITIGATMPASSMLEFEYSLSSSRENYYVLSGTFTPSGLVTKPGTTNQSKLIKNTSATYNLVPLTTTQELRNFNNFIRYKANHKTFMVDTDDRLLDYIVSGGALTLEQDDILFDTAKTNKRMPLLTRRIPWYIIIYPTNRFENLIFNSTSKITSYDPSGQVTRKLKFSPTINQNLSNSKANRFIEVKYGYPNYPNVYGQTNTVSRISELIPTGPMYLTGCKVRGQVGATSVLNPLRSKTGLRLIYEIITELNNNYILDNQGLGNGLNTFDVISRLNMSEFNKFMATENSGALIPIIRNGLVEGVEISPPVRNAGRNAMRKTRLVQRKVDAAPDTFRSIKAMSTGFLVAPPGTAFNSSKIVPTDPVEGPITR